MNIDLIVIGKTDSAEIASLVANYAKRLNRYLKFSLICLPDVRSSRKLPEEKQRKAEGESILKQLSPGDYVVLLDERGAQPRSVEFAGWLEKKMVSATKRLCFIVGGPYGFSEEVYSRADESLSLSRMTFSHQIIRAIFAEQLYRALSIIKNEPYHHE